MAMTLNIQLMQNRKAKSKLQRFKYRCAQAEPIQSLMYLRQFCLEKWAKHPVARCAKTYRDIHTYMQERCGCNWCTLLQHTKHHLFKNVLSHLDIIRCTFLMQKSKNIQIINNYSLTGYFRVKSQI